MKVPRFLHRLYAFFNGYFWLPCPLCGRHFGGHEWRVSWMYNYQEGIGVCSNCTEVARKHNEALFKNLPHMEIKL